MTRAADFLTQKQVVDVEDMNEIIHGGEKGAQTSNQGINVLNDSWLDTIREIEDLSKGKRHWTGILKIMVNHLESENKMIWALANEVVTWIAEHHTKVHNKRKWKLMQKKNTKERNSSPQHNK